MRTRLPILSLAALVIVAATAATPAPARAQNREHQQMAADLRMMQEQAQQLALTLAQLNDAIKAVNGSIGDSNQANLRKFADIENTLRGMAGDLNAMRTRTDETNTLIRTLSEDINALKKTLVDLPGRLTEITRQMTFQPPVDPNDPNAVAGAPPAPVVPPPSFPTVGLIPSQVYETAMGDYGAGQWTAAISGFEQFLKSFPDSQRAGAAQFYIGEAHFAQTRWEDAIRAYDAVVRNYPKDDYAPQAIWKRGLAQLRIQQPEAARASFEQVIKAYPNHDAASLARQRLGGMAPPPPTRKP